MPSLFQCLVSLADGELFCSGGEHISVWNQSGALLSTYCRKPEEEGSFLWERADFDLFIDTTDVDLFINTTPGKGLT